MFAPRERVPSTETLMNNTEKRNENYYINIADWMIAFKLPISELLTYAIVYSFNQAKDNCYHGSTKEMAWLLGISSKSKASEYLNSLESKGLLRKQEVKVPGKQTCCKYYVTTDRTGTVESQMDVDYITVQPWMFKKLGLRNSQLLVYARIHNLSRSKNYYNYDPEDLLFWTGYKTEKELKRRVINKLLIDKNITLSDTYYEGYKTVVPKEIINSKDAGGKKGTPREKGEHLISNEGNKGTPGGKKGTLSGKKGTNKLIKLIKLNLDKLNNVVVRGDETRDALISKWIEAIVYSSEEFEIQQEAGNVMVAINATNRLIKNICSQSDAKVMKVLELPKNKIIELFTDSLKVVEDINNTFNNPDGYIVSRLQKYLKEG